jgi:hypothetical protein
MGGLNFNLENARKTAFRITAYVNARVFRRDLHAEVDRIEDQPRSKSYTETGLTMSVLLALALTAASFGWIGLCVYFLALLIFL